MRPLTDKLRALFEPLEQDATFKGMQNALSEGETCACYGADDAQRRYLIAALVRRTKRSAVVVEPNDVAAQRTAEELGVLLDGRARLLAARDLTFLRASATSRELNLRRIETLGDCLNGETAALVVSASTLSHRLAPARRFASHLMTLGVSDTIEPQALMEKLTRAGYERVHLVDGRGQCALRGGILDLYPVGEANALRIEFFDDEIDSIRSFDVLTQRSISERDRVRIFPGTEYIFDPDERAGASERFEGWIRASEGALVRDRQRSAEVLLRTFQVSDAPTEGGALSRYFGATLDAIRTGRSFDGSDALLPVLFGFEAYPWDYLDDPIVIFNQPERVREAFDIALDEFHEQFSQALENRTALPEQGRLLRPFDDIQAALSAKPVLLMGPYARTQQDFAPRALFHYEGRNATAYQSNLKELCQDLTAWISQGRRVAVCMSGSSRAARLDKALGALEVPSRLTDGAPNSLEPGAVHVFTLALGRGFTDASLGLSILTEGDIYGVNRQKNRRTAKASERIEAFTDLRVGDYVVHEHHGIGQYMGIVRLSSEGVLRDFLHIRYLGNDKLYVPTDQLDRVQKYIGSEEHPKLNSLSGGDWQKQKSKVRQSIREIAGDLIKLYARRESIPGHAFEPDTPWQREFEDNFPFEETPDQLAAIDEIKRDMEAPKVMDRLLCGDVGYGKTEVALRAMFKCVMGGKQAVMLAPTTVLVQQHYGTMINRFSGFPITIESLSRFKTAAQQKDVLKRLREGGIDVLVGTHRLLGKDVKFKDLGLLVVDEEQRFGVTHKEAIKRLRQSVDVLTLTATPIPRTLHMSMVGIRDMSLLQSPPEERYPIQTYVMEYSDGLVRDAILRELARGGQVYVLYNRVQTIETMYVRLKNLVPEARIAIGHGQMREHALEDVMLDFYDGKYDVLLCTTIIEAGLDVPRANTLIVCDADRFGLSQLYQLRGRVGRSNRLAYAYLTFQANKVLTEDAEQRLMAIREFTEFGSGFRVAMRDLEIRGAGNLLGAEQSGFMAAVGYDLYVKMIEETLRELRGDAAPQDIDARIDMRINAYIPDGYIADDLLRIEMYKKIADVRRPKQREDLIDEFIDRFGDPPAPVLRLVDIALLKSLCASIGIDYVARRPSGLMLRFAMDAQVDLVRVLTAVKAQSVLTVRGGNPPMLVCDAVRISDEALLSKALEAMTRVVSAYEEEGAA